VAGSLDGGLAEKRRWVGGAASGLGATPTGNFGAGFNGWSTRTSSHSFANLYGAFAAGSERAGASEATVVGRVQVLDRDHWGFEGHNGEGVSKGSLL
jgi:hypothetical protein